MCSSQSFMIAKLRRYNLNFRTFCCSDRVNTQQQQQLRRVLDGLQHNVFEPDVAVFRWLLRVCTDVEALCEGRLVHGQVAKCKLELALGNQLVQMYVKCGSLEDAQEVFNRMPCRNVMSWTAVIAAYAQSGRFEVAFALFQKMQLEGATSNKIIFVQILSACTDLAEGKLTHACISESGIESDCVVGNALVNMYGKCGSAEDALLVFKRMLERDVISWTSMVAAYAQNGHPKEAFEVFQQMQLEGVMPNKVTFLAILNACSNPAQGFLVHTCITESGISSNIMVGSALIDMYGKCKALEAAQRVFDSMQQRNVVSWNSLIAAYSQNGHFDYAFRLFRQMQLEGVVPARVTFINTCPAPRNLAEGLLIEACINESGIQLDLVLGTALIDMYGNCGSVEHAYSIFNRMSDRNVVSWNAMLVVATQHGQFQEAIQLFQQMQLRPDRLTYATILNACANIGALDGGKLVHAAIVKSGLELDVRLATALLHMYSKCNCVEEARNVFDSIEDPDVVAWTAMISGYAQNGCHIEAISLFREMKLMPDKVTLVTILNECASVGSLTDGKLIHEQIVERGLQSEIITGNAVLDMYGKCGSIEETSQFFSKMMQRDRVSWNTMIAAYAQNGHIYECLQHFQQMQLEGVNPDEVTFVCLLSAFSHAGLVVTGCKCFASISGDYTMAPTVEQHGCIVDLLGRAGWLDIAEDHINQLPFKPDSFMWSIMLSACRIHADIERGENAAERVLKLDPQSDAAHVVLSNIYATAECEDLL